MYAIFRVYDVDGGMGDAVKRKDLLGVVPTEESAQEYCKKYSNKVLTDEHYSRLYDGELQFTEIKELSLNKRPFTVSKRRDGYFDVEMSKDIYID